MELIGLEVGSVRKEPNLYDWQNPKSVANGERKEINCSKAVMCRIVEWREDNNTKVMCVEKDEDSIEEKEKEL